MKIRPRNYITYAAQGVKFSPSNVGGTNWLNIFRGYRQHLLDQWRSRRLWKLAE